MSNYIENFLERNKDKSFISNLNKYFELNHYGKCKVISSFLTHLFIDAEQFENSDLEIFDENLKTQQEIISILNEMVLYRIDNFIEWITCKVNDNG